MKRYMERVWELMNGADAAKMIPLYDEENPKGVSYEQIRIISGRVYAYLKAKNIGKEDFVLIKLPRGIKPVIAMAGVWRAGAAFVIAEEVMAITFSRAAVNTSSAFSPLFASIIANAS